MCDTLRGCSPAPWKSLPPVPTVMNASFFFLNKQTENAALQVPCAPQLGRPGSSPCAFGAHRPRGAGWAVAGHAQQQAVMHDRCKCFSIMRIF